MPHQFKNIPIKVIPADKETQSALYEVRKKIYPRHVSGWWANWRILFVVLTQVFFYGALWLPWHGRQALLFDLAARKFYIFGLVLWPQDLIYLAGLLVISAFGLFWWTTIAGRLWCGFTCPQTVYTQIFLWIEHWVEGDRSKRIKLDKEPFNLRKFRLKFTKHSLWILFSLWTGFTFVGYFTPVHTLVSNITNFVVGPWATFWILFYGLATYGNAGWMREQVCKYMCPYARFQGVMFDRDTLIISYDENRGEARGSRNKKDDYKAEGLGDCIDCGICVQVCPTGIDIRNGLQYECIGCAACIDACDQVMDKMGYPRGLIRYSTENAMEGRYKEEKLLSHILRPRVIIYTILLAAISSTLLITLALRDPIKVNVMRDRNAFARETEDGLIENTYRIQIMNTDEKPHQFVIRLQDLPETAKLKVDQHESLLIAPATTETLPVRIQVDPNDLKKGGTQFYFEIQAQDNNRLKVKEKTTFINR